MIKISIHKQHKSIFLLLLIFAFSLKQKAQVCDWDAIGDDDFKQSSLYQTQYANMAIDANGTPYIIYKDLAYSGTGATVKKYNGSAWVTLGPSTFTVNSSFYATIAIDPLGTPYVAYQDNSNYTTVVKFNGTAWVNVGNPSFTPAQGYQPSIAIDQSGTPYVFFGDGSNFNTGRVMKFNGSSWITVGNINITNGAPPASAKIIFDGSGTLYVVYKDAITGLANASKLVGSTWVSLSNGGITNTNIGAIDMAIDNSGVPYIVYCEMNNSQQASVLKYNGINWVYVGNQLISPAAANYPTIAIDNYGTPYIAYKDGSNFSKAAVLKFNGSSWVSVGNPGALTGLADFPHIMITGTGTIYVGYTDLVNDWKTEVLKYTGISWQNISNQGISAGKAEYNDMALDANGNPYLVYSDVINQGKATVKKYNNGVWTTVGVEGFTPQLIDYTSIATDASGTPYVVFSDYFAKVMKYNGTSWVYVGTPNISAGNADYTDIAIDASGTPYIVFADYANGQKATVMKYNGTSWVNVGSPGFSSNQAYYCDIVIDASGTPYVAFGDGGNAAVMKYNGTAWVSVGSLVSSGVAQFISIVLDSFNSPLIAYSYYLGGAEVQKFNGTSWSIVGSTISTASEYTQLALDASNTPYIIYSDPSITLSGKATVKKFDGTSWVDIGTPGLSAYNAKYNSIAIDANNKIYLSYASTGAFAKRFQLVTTVSVSASQVCEGSGITLNASGGSTYSWGGPSSFTSNIQSPSISNISLSQSGIYTVTISDASCVSATKFVNVTVNPNPTITVSNGTLCLGNTFTINPTGAYSYTFQGGNAVVSPTANSSYTISGTSLAGCMSQSTATVNLSVSALPLPTVTVNSGSVCQGSSFTLTPSGASTYTFQGGNAVVSPTANSSYTVIGTATNGCISQSSATASIIFNAAPSILGNSGTICSGNSYTINPSGAITYTIQGGNSIVTPSATTNYTIIGTDANGCVSQFFTMMTVVVQPTPTITVNSGTICTGQSFTINPTGAYTYTFEGGNAIVSPTTNSTYTVIGTAFNGCVSQSFVTSTVSSLATSPPTITVNSGSICSGNSFTINPSGANTYTVQGGNSVVSPITNSSYTVNGSNIMGCISQNIAVANVTVNLSPTITVNSSSICTGQSFTINPAGANVYTIQGNNLIVSPIINTSYTVIGAALNGCVSQTFATSSVLVNSTPTLTVNSGSICIGQSFTINPIGAINYTIQGGNAVVSPTATSNYIVFGDNNNSCISNLTSSVAVNQLPIIVVSSGSICTGDSFTINPNGANSYTISGGSAIVSPTVTTTYTVTGTDLNNCDNTQTVSIQTNTTCVWPGDANSDGITDNLDVLELGLHYLQTGTSRASLSNLWQGFYGTDWTGLITNGKNLKHSDCNGDGIIDQNDTLAIYINYNLTHLFKQNNITISNPQLNIISDQNIVANGQWGTAAIYLGDTLNPFNSINGIAFTINFDHTLIEQDSIWLEYTSSFLNFTNTNLHFRKTDFTNDLLYTATTHTNNLDVSGYGKIAILHYKILSSLTSTNVLNLSLTLANQSNANGILTPLSVGTSSVLIDSSVGIKENLNEAIISIIPNPTKDKVVITIKNNNEIQNINLEIINALGQKVLTANMNQSSTSISLADLPSGVYYLKMQQVNFNRVFKIIKE